MRKTESNMIILQSEVYAQSSISTCAMEALPILSVRDLLHINLLTYVAISCQFPFLVWLGLMFLFLWC